MPARTTASSRPFSLTIPPRTVFSAEPPAPTGWYYEGAAFANDLFWKALAPVCPDRLGAGSYTSLCCSYVVGQDAETGELFVLAEPNVGGWGGSALGDGESALIATTDGDTYNFPVEVVEARFPVLVERYELNVGAGGGAGQAPRRVRRRSRVPRSTARARRTATARIGGHERRPWALGGGREGTNNYLEYAHAKHNQPPRARRTCGARRRRPRALGDRDGRRVRRSRAEREPERVRDDVLDGYVTVDAARAEYGVALDPATLELDAAETARLRGG